MRHIAAVLLILAAGAVACGGAETDPVYADVDLACSADQACPAGLACMPSHAAGSACFVEQDGSPYGGCPEGGANVEWGWYTVDPKSGQVLDSHAFAGCTRKCASSADCAPGPTTCVDSGEGYGVCVLPML